MAGRVALMITLKLLALIIVLTVSLESAIISPNSTDLVVQNDTVTNSTTNATQATAVNGTAPGNTVSISEQNDVSILESSDIGSKATVAILVRRHGDFDDEDEKEKESPKPYESVKTVHTRVMSSEAVDENACKGSIKGPLIRLTGNSKYFADSENKYTYEEAKELCSDFNLVLAEIENIADHRSLTFFVKQYRVVEGCSKKFLIGANDMKEEGVFTRANGDDLLFQNFHLTQPDDKNQDEDCVALMKEVAGGPVGSDDVNCNTPANVLCMFPPGTECYKGSRETEDAEEIIKRRGLISVANVSGVMSYYASNFQLTWNRAMKYCIKKNMSLFSMDGDVTMRIFEALLNWESNFVQATSSPPLQYWTSGRFQGTHMNAPIMWATHPMTTSSSEEETGDEQSPYTLLRSTNFTWSGVYKWSSKKETDPGGPHGYRRDVCVSFGFEDRPEATPSIRNTNCELPTYFVCAQHHPKKEIVEDKK